MKRFKYLLLDIEGTIVLDKLYTPVSGSVKWFNNLKSCGIQSRLVTNNTTESPEELFNILRRKGFSFNKEDYYTCLAEAITLMKRRDVKSCLALTKPAVKQYLKSQGIKPLDNAKVESILVGYDPKLDYKKMNMAVNAIVENNAILFTLHRNRRFMNEKRQIAMSAGPITAALENASMTRAIVSGKPSRRFFLDSIKGWDVPREKILMVSDDPFADLIGAKKLGMSTCWVLTGSVRDKKALDKIPQALRPDYTINSVLDILT